MNRQVSMNRETSQKERAISPDPQITQQLEEWMELVATRRDKHAFTSLFQFFAPKIKRFGFNKLGSEFAANELIQETMTSVWKKAHLFDSSKGAATTWVYTVMRNACFDMLRKIQAKPEQNLADDLWPIDSVSDEATNDDNAFKDHLMSKEMLRYVDGLPPAQKTVVKGVYYQELSQEQLAQQLGVPLGTVKSRLRLALAKLKQQMGEQFHD
ncbi:sigma-70 family RNA polymerase sigma factor [Vibrio paucivorans]